MSAGKARLRGDRLHDMTSRHHTPYLSASRFSLYSECPALYKRRYVDQIFDPPTIDMEYGQAIHTGLDAHFKGGDGELAFMRDLKHRLEALITRGADPADWLVPQGLKLISEVSRLGWRGESEQQIIWIAAGFKLPIRGVIDLWSSDGSRVVDWKTTRSVWSQTTAEKYQWQRAIYAQAMIEKHQCEVVFQFVPLGAYPGGRMQIIDATPSPTEVFRTLELARSIAARIELEEWACDCRDKKHQDVAA